jgi:hypothetical protein
LNLTTFCEEENAVLVSTMREDEYAVESTDEANVRPPTLPERLGSVDVMSSLKSKCAVSVLSTPVVE